MKIDKDTLKKQVLGAASVPTQAPSITAAPPYFHKGMEENPRAKHGAGGPPSPFRKMTT